MGVKTISVKEDVFADSLKVAEDTRRRLKEQGTYFINFMSSPGSGKTTLLCRLINDLKNDYKIGEMDVDIETDTDARRVADQTGVECLQIHNFGLCHIDADMTHRALEEYDTKDKDLLILENIGNLVCPAEFDTGAHENYVILSVPEGDDKPLKYPLMFTVANIVIFTKMDTLPYFDFDLEQAKKNILDLNPTAKFFCVSSVTGSGMKELEDYIKNQIDLIKK